MLLYDGLLHLPPPPLPPLLLRDLLRPRPPPRLSSPRRSSRSSRRPPPPPPRLSPLSLLLPLLISTLTLAPAILVPSRPLTASSASLGSSISTNPNPGGLLATHTAFTRPYLEKASSKSNLFASSLSPPM